MTVSLRELEMSSILSSYSLAFFRFGHSQVNNELWRFDEEGNPIKEGHLPLRDSYFAPERILYEGGIDPILRGSFAQPAQEVDTKVRLSVFISFTEIQVFQTYDIRLSSIYANKYY